MRKKIKSLIIFPILIIVLFFIYQGISVKEIQQTLFQSKQLSINQEVEVLIKCLEKNSQSCSNKEFLINFIEELDRQPGTYAAVFNNDLIQLTKRTVTRRPFTPFDYPQIKEKIETRTSGVIDVAFEDGDETYIKHVRFDWIQIENESLLIVVGTSKYSVELTHPMFFLYGGFTLLLVMVIYILLSITAVYSMKEYCEKRINNLTK